MPRGYRHIGCQGAVHRAHRTNGSTAQDRSKLETPDTGASGGNQTVFQGVFCCKGDQNLMMSRSVSRRLERLEETATPACVRKIWRIVILDSDGSRRDGPTIEWPRVAPGPTLSERFQDFEKTRLNEAGSR